VHDEAELGKVAEGYLADLTLWTADWKPVGTLVEGQP
jgi:N-acetylglucosamine-6-phosphate deacetylase